jgi:hypothetical protein
MPDVVAENDPQGNGPPYTYDPANGTKTRLSFSMAGAWSPNLAATPPIDFILDDQGDVDSTVFDLWVPHFPARIFDGAEESIGDLPLFFDCGTEDELNIYPTNVAMKDTLVAHGHDVHEGEDLSQRYVFQSYTGDHSSQLSDRIPVGLEFCNDWMLATSSVGGGEQPGGAALPASITLRPAWPNPFNGATALRFDLAAPGGVELAVYDLLGRRVATLAEGRLAAGAHRARWQPAAAVASGVYIVRLQAEGQSHARRIQYLK